MRAHGKAKKMQKARAEQRGNDRSGNLEGGAMTVVKLRESGASLKKIQPVTDEASEGEDVSEKHEGGKRLSPHRQAIEFGKQVGTSVQGAASVVFEGGGAVGNEMARLANYDPNSDMKEAKLDLNDKVEVRNAVKEIWLTIIFMALFTYLTTRNIFDARHSAFQLGQGIVTRLTGLGDADAEQTFGRVETLDDLHTWMSAVFIPAAYDEAPALEGNDILRYAHFVGSIRIAQLRANGKECSLRSGSWDLHGEWECYPKGNAEQFLLPFENTEDFSVFENRKQNSTIRSPFRYDGLNGETGEPLDYITVADGRSIPFVSTYRSHEAVTYPSPAFAVTLSPTLTQERAHEVIEDLIASKYIDLQTKAIFIDLNVYNPTIKRFCMIRLLAELDDGGRIMTSFDFSTVAIESLPMTELVIKIFIMLIYACFVLRESLQLRDDGWAYWRSGLNWLEIANIFCFFSSVVVRECARIYVPKDVDPHSDHFYDFSQPVRLQLVAISLEAIAVICNWFKMIPILSLSKTFMVMVKTIAKSARQVVGFFFIFMMIMFGFTQAHTMVYGYRLYQYHSMEKSFFSLLKSLLGDFDFDELRDANPYIGPGLFLLFVGLAVFVLLNMLIAIISDAYEESVEEIAMESELELLKMIFLYMQEVIYDIPIVGSCFKKSTQAVGKIAHRGVAVGKLATGKSKVLMGRVGAGGKEGGGDGTEAKREAQLMVAALTAGNPTKDGHMKHSAQLPHIPDIPKRRPSLIEMAGSIEHIFENLVRPKKGLRSMTRKIVARQTLEERFDKVHAAKHERRGRGGGGMDAVEIERIMEATMKHNLGAALDQFKREILESLQEKREGGSKFKKDILQCLRIGAVQAGSAVNITGNQYGSTQRAMNGVHKPGAGVSPAVVNMCLNENVSAEVREVAEDLVDTVSAWNKLQQQKDNTRLELDAAAAGILRL
jgi:hypothetical protein